MIIVCGLPGTGKTMLCKRLQDKLNCEYISDWEIFDKNNVVIDNLQNKLEVSKNYSSLILDYINDNKDKNIVIDLEYSISPKCFADSNICEFSTIIYLGFIETPENILFELFSKSSSNQKYDEAQLKSKIKFYKEMSEIYFNQCRLYNLNFIDINKDRNEIINSIISNIKA